MITKPIQILQMLIVAAGMTLATSSVCVGETLHISKNNVVADLAPTIAQMAKDRRLKPGFDLLYEHQQTGTRIFAETDNNNIIGFSSRTRDGKYLPLKLWKGEKRRDGGLDIWARYSSEISYNDISNCNLAIVFPDTFGNPEPYICVVPSGYQFFEIVRPHGYERSRYWYQPYEEYESHYQERHESRYRESQYSHASSPAGTTRSSSGRKGGR